jgi:flavin-dependent dehydrogenase
VIGAGPAGSAAAIAALRAGTGVELFEKSHFPRHKVCGEFLSPEILPLLDSLGVLNDFNDAGPAAIRRLALRFASADKFCKLPETAFGLSRYMFDELLFRNAVRLGARVNPEAQSAVVPTVIAHGRKTPSSRGGRLFGFKAHFDGPADDAIELFFFDRCYVGLNAIEGDITNVCGLGPEELLARHHFDIDAVVNSSEKLRERLRPLRRKFRWLTVGPLVFGNRFHSDFESREYLAGDALSFVDPFTGSGMLSAMVSGRLAGMAAASGDGVDKYVGQCRRALERPFQVASLFRGLLARGWGERLAGLVPGGLLVSLTRPHRVI